MEPFHAKAAVARLTVMPLSSSHCAMRLASASLRWPGPTGMTKPFGYAVIQLCSASVKPRLWISGSSQQFGRGASFAPRTNISAWSASSSARCSTQKSADDQNPTYCAVLEPRRPLQPGPELHISSVEPSTPKKAP